MTAPPSELHVTLDWVCVALDLLAAILGSLGAYWMATRYASSFFSGIKFAFLSLYLYAKGEGLRVEESYLDDYRGNEDVPESPVHFALGMNLLFLTFVLQLAKILLSLVASRI